MSFSRKDHIVLNYLNMESPPPKPQFKQETLKTTTKKPLERTAKTPFQSSNLYHKSFKSELQPNRILSRFHTENNNFRSNTRFYPSTSQRHITRLNTGGNGTTTTSTKPTDPIISRLGFSFVGAKGGAGTEGGGVGGGEAAKEQPSSSQPQSTRHLQPQLQVPQLVKPLSLPQLKPLTQTKPLEVPKKVEQVVEQDVKASASHLSETRRTQVQTPHISRAHSEPSIKYQVQVNDKTYKILRKIGSGGSAKVYEGFESLTSQTVAIKIINVAQADPKTQESYFNEKALLKRLRDSKYVVRMYDSEYKAKCKELVIVMEKGDADLSQVIDSYFRNKNNMIDGLFIKFYWRGMVQAVNAIHQHGIVHADLKPVNFILVKNEIKLIDFGIASAVDPGGTSVIRDYQIGTINYMAPESLRNRALDASFQQYSKNEVDENNQHQHYNMTVIKYNCKADIWSLGCILYNLVYGRPPFDKYKDIISKVQAITDPRHLIEFPEISNRNLMNCMKLCLRYNPADRPTAEELLNDSYLREDIIMLQQSVVKSA